MVGDTDTCDATLPTVSTIFARPKSSTFTVPSARSLMLAGFRIAMNDPLVVCCLQRFGNLLCGSQRFINRHRTFGDAVCQGGTVDELHYQRSLSAGSLEAIDRGNEARTKCERHRDQTEAARL